MLYFAYGSNLNKYRFEERIGEHKIISKYLLKDYDLVFNTGQSIAYASIIKKKGAFVEGVVYEINSFQEHILDQYEGIKLRTYTKEYIDYLGEPMLVYIGKLLTHSNPSLWYLLIILQGCIDFELTKTKEKIENLIETLY